MLFLPLPTQEIELTDRTYLLAEVSEIKRVLRLEDMTFLVPPNFKAVVIDKAYPNKMGKKMTLSMDKFAIFLFENENRGIYTNGRHVPNPDKNPREGQKIIVICSGPEMRPIGWGDPEDYERVKAEAHLINEQRELRKHTAKVESAELAHLDEE